MLVPLLAPAAADPSDAVRQNLVEVLGLIGAASPETKRSGRRQSRVLQLRVRWMHRWYSWKRGPAPAPSGDPIQLAVLTLKAALADNSAAVRTIAARSLGRFGLTAAAVAPDLIALLQDADEKGALRGGRVPWEGQRQ